MTVKQFFATVPLAVICFLWFLSDLSTCSAGRLFKRDAPCNDSQFAGSPETTKHPTKGEQLVQDGRTLLQEAEDNAKAGYIELKRAIDFAKSNTRYKTEIQHYGKSMGLDGNETLAIFCYTLDDFTPALHDKFNEALRNGNDCKYPVYHYWLDSGIKKLLRKQGSQKGYHYRGNKRFFIFNQTTTTTFPGFTSTSKNYSVAKGDSFWKEGCSMMNITTNLGADISLLSNYSEELEVLFPPYEVFNVSTYDRDADGIPIITIETTESAIPIITIATTETPIPIITIATTESPIPIITIATTESPIPIITTETTKFPVSPKDCTRHKRDTRLCNPGGPTSSSQNPAFSASTVFFVIVVFLIT